MDSHPCWNCGMLNVHFKTKGIPSRGHPVAGRKTTPLIVLSFLVALKIVQIITKA